MNESDPASSESGDAPTPFSLRGLLRELYFGGDRRATRFQLAL